MNKKTRRIHFGEFSYFYAMNELSEIQLLQQTLSSKTGMSKETFELSIPYWQLKTYKKGEFYTEYKSVCKHLGFVINGVFRVYRTNPGTGEEKNMLFFTNNQ